MNELIKDEYNRDLTDYFILVLGISLCKLLIFSHISKNEINIEEKWMMIKINPVYDCRKSYSLLKIEQSSTLT